MEAQREIPVFHRPVDVPSRRRRFRSPTDAGLVIYDAGLVGTMLMAMVVYIAPLFGLRTFDIGSIIAASIEGHAVPAGTGSWWLGLLIFLLIGTYALPTLYALTFYQVRPMFSWKTGAAYGFILWAVTAIVAAGILSWGQLFTGLLGFLAYGASFGYVAAPHANRMADVDSRFQRLKKI